MDYSQMTDDELNTLTATRIMGWYADIVENEWGLRFYKDGISTVMDARGWQPTSNLNQAVMVAEEFASFFEVAYFRSGKSKYMAYVEKEPLHKHIEGRGDNPARALVIACLMAVEGEG